ncbi:MAG: serine/threonine protein kinase, partial [Planctomycetales bacterium]|nr:serine/threonine protein kinase [Planctomycetales bacterium]
MPPRPSGSDAPLDVPSDVPSDFFENSTTGVPPGETGKPPPRLGSYEVGALLGRGGMGEVYRARHASLGRGVALKLLAPGAPAELRTRFLREARTAARLRHPNIVTVHDAGEEGGYAWIAMDLVEGRSVAALLHDETLDGHRAAVIAEKIARALAHAHAEGVIHRDVKPGNILLDASGEPRLADFGLARDVGHSAGLSRPGVTLGTPSYMPPEQAAGKLGTVDGRADVWSLGACLHEMLTGSPAFDGETPLAIMAKVLSDDPPPVRRLAPHVGRDLETIVSRCLEKDPNRRYAGAQALADDLGRFLRSNPIAARRIGPVGRLARRARRNPLPFVLGAVALLLGLAAGTVLLARAAAERGERGADLLVARELTPTDPRRAQGILARWAERSPGDPEIAAALAAAEESARALATAEARAAARVHLLRADEERRAFRRATDRLAALSGRGTPDPSAPGAGAGADAPADDPAP